jgi:tRNA G10  N-methylase Trm11
MKYIFFLGRNPTLSLAEIQALLEKFKLSYTVSLLDPTLLILDIEEEFSVRDLFVQLGGTLKIAEVIASVKEEDLRERIVTTIKSVLEERPNKKSVGYSIYFTKNEGKDKAGAKNDLMRDIFSKMKREELAEASIRIVYPEGDELALSTATAFNNRLDSPSKGIEFDLIYSGSRIILGRTLIIQDIRSYSQRDYEKPGRDAKIGMMPPKLAQAMINLARIKEGQTIFDPFCGTGTIMQEALLNDYRVIGSDANGEQVEKCKKNMDWISKEYVLTYPDYKLFQAGFGEAMRSLKPDSIDAIVTESTLGPVYKKLPGAKEIRDNYAHINKLYIRFLDSAKSVLKNKGRIVVTLPAYQLKPREYVFGEFVDSLEKLGYSKVCPLDSKFISADTRITKRDTIIYSRPEQIVAREIIIFQNNK